MSLVVSGTLNSLAWQQKARFECQLQLYSAMLTAVLSCHAPLRPEIAPTLRSIRGKQVNTQGVPLKQIKRFFFGLVAHLTPTNCPYTQLFMFNGMIAYMLLGAVAYRLARPRVFLWVGNNRTSNNKTV